MASTAAASFAPSPPSPLMRLIRRAGLDAPSDAELAGADHLTEAELWARYPDRAALLRDTLAQDLARQQQDHGLMYEVYPSPVERLFGLINYSIADLADTSPQYLADLVQHPSSLELLQDHLATYSTPQLQRILNDGIRQGLFRSDINIQLVVIVIIQQLNIVLTPTAFPATASSAEIFRSVFLYYIRGLCTEDGARQAAEHFARM